MLGRLVKTGFAACAVGSAGANRNESVSSTTQSTTGLPIVSNQSVSQRPEFDGNLSNFASIAFEVADADMQVPQAIATLYAGDQVKDEFGTGNDKFERMSKEDIATTFNRKGISIRQSDGTTFVDYNLGLNKVKIDGNWVDAHILMYKSNNNQYILQVNGKLIHIKDGYTTNSIGFITKGVDLHCTEDEVKRFSIEMGITKHTVLGSKIILKAALSKEANDMRTLDKTFMDPSAEYLKCVQEGRENCRPTTSAPNSSANTTQTLEVLQTTSSKPVSSAYGLRVSLSAAVATAFIR